MLLPKPRALWLLPLFLLAVPAHATLNDALLTGDPSQLPALESEIVDAALLQIKTYQSNQNKLLTGIYGSGAIDYAPGNRTQLLVIQENESVFRCCRVIKAKFWRCKVRLAVDGLPLLVRSQAVIFWRGKIWLMKTALSGFWGGC